ncbi:unnamed protein product [Microthlaspi erraticum]|uniref:Uncharacterized protein n=1 Tax=Microthlaspi erraticum TaxID=1685480 RepID=A0A6D2LBN8_9BRAS|nr:unnamed protein product [Microthlaspi erraticum]
MKSSAIKVNKAVKVSSTKSSSRVEQSTSSIEFRDELRQTKLKLDRVEAWPVELRNSTGWSSRRSSWSSRWLLPSSFAYPVELLPCAKSLHAPCVPYAPECSKRPISKDQTCICLLEHSGAYGTQGAWRDLAHGSSSTGYAKEEGRSHLEDQLDRPLDQPVEFLNSTGQASTRSSWGSQSQTRKMLLPP